MSGLQESQKSTSAPAAIIPIGIGSVKQCTKCGASDRNARGDCRPCSRASHAKYRAGNPELVKASSAKSRAAHPEREKARLAKYHTAHPERSKARLDKWREANPENCKALDHKRRARKLKAGGSFSVAEIRAMLKRQRGKCVACRIDISKNYHIDHRMPLALGGSNDVSNIQLLCPHCNLSKHAKHPIEFMQERGFLL